MRSIQEKSKEDEYGCMRNKTQSLQGSLVEWG